MLKLAAFADEISPDLDVQIQICLANGVGHVELRGVDGINVLDFNDALCNRIRLTLAEHGMSVACIASPIGKVAIDKPWSEHFDRFKRAVELAEFFGAKLIRVFSYYPAGGEGKGEVAPLRDEVVKRFREKLAHIKGRDVTLVHENEKGIFGDIGSRCIDLMRTIDHPQLRCAFDFANFVQCKQRPLECWSALKPFTAHIHIKDAKWADGSVVPAGQGDGEIAAIVSDAYASGYRGLLSLEPHLKVAGHSHGETGADLFKVAADAIKAVCKTANVPLYLKS